MSSTVYRFNPYTPNGESPYLIMQQKPFSSSSFASPICRPPSPIAAGGTDTESMISAEEDSPSSSFPSSVSSGPLKGGMTPPLAHFTPQQQYHSSQGQPLMKPLAHIVPLTSASSPVNFSQQPQQPSISQYREMKGNVHQKLNGSTALTYVTYDKIQTGTVSSSHVRNYHGSPATTVRLFVGQVLHEVGATQLANLFALLCDVTVIRCDPHGPGCFFVEIPASQFRAARQINGRVLFDVKGMWVAENPDAAKELHDYMASVKKELKTVRLPRSALVVRK